MSVGSAGTDKDTNVPPQNYGGVTPNLAKAFNEEVKSSTISELTVKEDMLGMVGLQQSASTLPGSTPFERNTKDVAEFASDFGAGLEFFATAVEHPVVAAKGLVGMTPAGQAYQAYSAATAAGESRAIAAMRGLVAAESTVLNMAYDATIGLASQAGMLQPNAVSHAYHVATGKSLIGDRSLEQDRTALLGSVGASASLLLGAAGSGSPKPMAPAPPTQGPVALDAHGFIPTELASADPTPGSFNPNVAKNSLLDEAEEQERYLFQNSHLGRDPLPGLPSPEITFAGHGIWLLFDGWITVPENTWVNIFTPIGTRMNEIIGMDVDQGLVNPLHTYGPGERMPNLRLLSHVGSDFAGHPMRTNLAGDPILTIETGGFPLSSLLRPNMGPVNWAACSTTVTSHF